MSKKVGLVHATMNSVQPILHAFQTLHPTVNLVNVMDEGLIWELNETNKVTESMIRRLIDIAGKAEDAGVDGILFTCSAFTPYISEVRHLFGVPTLCANESMLMKAIEIGDKIGVIATVEKSAYISKTLLHSYAKVKRRSIDVATVAIPEAFQALQKANSARHDEMIHAEIDKLARDVDAVVLAQYSMARALESYEGKSGSIPILTGPEVSANAIVELVEV